MEYKYLVCVDGNENHYKYYEIKPQGDMFQVKYGRVGNTNFQTCTYPSAQFSKKYNEKIKKGYVDKTELKAELVEEVTTNDSPLAEIKNRSVALILKRLQDFANNTIKANYTVAQAEITQAMVDEAQAILSDMVKIDTLEDFNDALLKLMAVIPRKVKVVKDYLPKKMEDIPNVIQNEQDLLDTLSGNIYKKPEVKEETKEDQGKAKTILDEMGIEMSETEESDIKVIKNMLGNDSNRYVNSWKVTNLASENKFQKYIKDNNIKDTKLLFHGTRSCNVFSILKSSLMLRPVSAVINGKLYGFGCYFSPLARKSIGYTSVSGSYWTSGHDNSGFMIIFETAYGTPYDVYNYNSEYGTMNYEKLQKFQKGANCLHAHAGASMGGYSTLKNDEIIFYDESAVHMKYLVEIK